MLSLSQIGFYALSYRIKEEKRKKTENIFLIQQTFTYIYTQSR